MNRGIITSCLAGFVLIGASTVQAAEPRVQIVQAGADRLSEDLKYLVGLSPDPTLKKQWQTIEDTLESFLMGVTRDKPLRLDLIFTPTELAYVTFIPFEGGKLDPRSPDGFLANLNSLGYASKSQGQGLWKLEDTAADITYALRELGGYALIGSSEKFVPANLPADSTAEVKDLLSAGYDVAAQLKNPAEGQEERAAQFQELRKELEAAVKFKRDESKESFELRKLAVVQNFNEMQRFVVETAELTIGWTTDVAGKSAKSDLSLTALAGTDLERSIQELAAKPSQFAALQLHDQPILGGKLNFPIDAMRQKHFREFYAAVKPVTAEEIDKRAGMTASGKAAAKKAMELFVGMLEEGIDLGVVDGFVDMHAGAGNQSVLIAAIRTVDGTKAVEIIKLLPQIRDDWKVQADVKDDQGVLLHKVIVPARRKAVFESLFPGSELAIHVGTSKDIVWFAIGEGSLTELTAAIKAVKETPESSEAVPPEVLTFTAKLGPWVKWLKTLQDNRPAPAKAPSKTELQAQKEREVRLNLANDALKAGNDVVQGWMKREGNKVLGEMTVQEGVLRAVGSLTAKFAKDNL